MVVVGGNRKKKIGGPGGVNLISKRPISNRTIIKGDMATFVKQCQNCVFPFFIRFNFFTFLFKKVWADCFLSGRTTLEVSSSCGRVIIITSLGHGLLAEQLPCICWASARHLSSLYQASVKNHYQSK